MRLESHCEFHADQLYVHSGLRENYFNFGGKGKKVQIKNLEEEERGGRERECVSVCVSGKECVSVCV